MDKELIEKISFLEEELTNKELERYEREVFSRNDKYLFNYWLDENVKESLARDIIRYTLECELHSVPSPGNRKYLSKHFTKKGKKWTPEIASKAVSYAKKTELIGTTGRGKFRQLELNVQKIRTCIATAKAKYSGIIYGKKFPDFSDNFMDFYETRKNNQGNIEGNIQGNIQGNIETKENGSTKPAIEEKPWYNNNKDNSNYINTYGEREKQLLSFERIPLSDGGDFVEKKVKASRGGAKYPFSLFWSLYPRKEDKKSALRAWLSLSADKQKLALDDLPSRIKTKKWVEQNGRFVLSAYKYLSGERWEDELEGSIINNKFKKYE